jgi:hypothetical protein
LLSQIKNDRATRLFRSSLFISGVIFFFVFIIFLGLLFRSFHGNLFAYIDAGGNFLNQLPNGMVPLKITSSNQQGFDGQFYLYQSYDPLLLGDWKNGMDCPTIRGRRVLFPFIVWLVSRLIGGDRFIPETLILLNLLSIFISLLGLTLIFRLNREEFWDKDRIRNNPYYALFLTLAVAFSPYLLIPMYKTTSEAVCTSFIIGSALAFSRRRIGVGYLLSACAILVKETSVLWVFALILISMEKRNGKRVLGSLLTLLPLLMWCTWLHFRFHSLQTGVSMNIDIPFCGMIKEIALVGKEGLNRRTIVIPLAMVSILLLFIWGVSEFTALPRHAAHWMLIISCILAFLMDSPNWDYILNFGRQPFPLLSGTALILAGPRVRHPMWGIAALWSVSAWGILYVLSKIVIGIP